MAKAKRSDPIIDAMCEAMLKQVEAMVIHSFGTGGPNAAIQVIDACVAQMMTIRQEAEETKAEIEKEMESLQQQGAT
jgi:hypothetical protein